MKKDFKKELLSYFDTGHRHESFMGMMKCRYCGEKFQKGKALIERKMREEPSLFLREKRKFEPSPELREMYWKLVERVKKDRLYRRHLERLQYGTKEEAERESRLAAAGYYDTHYEENGEIKTIKKDEANKNIL